MSALKNAFFCQKLVLYLCLFSDFVDREGYPQVPEGLQRLQGIQWYPDYKVSPIDDYKRWPGLQYNCTHSWIIDIGIEQRQMFIRQICPALKLKTFRFQLFTIIDFALNSPGKDLFKITLHFLPLSVRKLKENNHLQHT